MVSSTLDITCVRPGPGSVRLGPGSVKPVPGSVRPEPDSVRPEPGVEFSSLRLHRESFGGDVVSYTVFDFNWCEGWGQNLWKSVEEPEVGIIDLVYE